MNRIASIAVASMALLVGCASDGEPSPTTLPPEPFNRAAVVEGARSALGALAPADRVDDMVDLVERGCSLDDAEFAQLYLKDPDDRAAGVVRDLLDAGCQDRVDDLAERTEFDPDAVVAYIETERPGQSQAKIDETLTLAETTCDQSDQEFTGTWAALADTDGEATRRLLQAACPGRILETGVLATGRTDP